MTIVPLRTSIELPKEDVFRPTSEKLACYMVNQIGQMAQYYMVIGSVTSQNAA